MSRVLILSELWYPQGGGAELATYLYTKKMVNAGERVTVVSNKDANLTDLPLVTRNTWLSPISRFGKPGLLLYRSSIAKKVASLAMTQDVVYLPGKLLLLAPTLRKANPSLKIIVHLHDYQLICGHASMHNFIQDQTCENIWSNSTCRNCTYRYESGRGIRISLKGILGFSENLVWKQISNIDQIIDSTDVFVTVSYQQAKIIETNLAEYANEFMKKNLTLYNPVSEKISYIPPLFGKKLCLAFLGGENYLKGYDLMKENVRKLNRDSVNILVTKSSHVKKEDGIDFLGFLPPDEMEHLFRKVWMVLFMSRWDEPLPYSLVESQLRGRPVIGGVNEAVARPGLTGDLIQHDFGSFETSVQHYSSILRDHSEEYTKEISGVAREIFGTRSERSCEAFLKLVGSS